MLQEEMEQRQCRTDAVDVWQRAVDTDRFNPKHASAEMRQRLSGGQPEAPLLLFAGRLGAGEMSRNIRQQLHLTAARKYRPVPPTHPPTRVQECLFSSCCTWMRKALYLIIGSPDRARLIMHPRPEVRCLCCPTAEKSIKALRGILEANPGARLALAGDGPQRQELQEHFAGLPVTFVVSCWSTPRPRHDGRGLLLGWHAERGVWCGMIWARRGSHMHLHDR
jgi:hypothetical protein